MQKFFPLFILILLSACASAMPAPANVTPTASGVQVIQVVATSAATRVPRANVLRVNLTGDADTLDPAFAQDPSAATIVEEIFVGLVRLDETTNQTRPGIATSSNLSADGKTYTLKLRGDVPWVKYDRATNQVVKIQTCPDRSKQTKDRVVVAKDFESGLLRVLRSSSPFALLLAPIEGADAYTSGANNDATKVGVKAIDDATLEIKLREPLAYAPTLLAITGAMAVPRWLIDGDTCVTKLGDKWADAANIQTYGPFALKDWTRGATITLTRNPFWVGDDATPQSKIDEVAFTMLDENAALAKFQTGELDATIVPASEFDRVKADANLAKLLTTAPNLCTYYFGFNTRAKTVDDVRVRRALSLALDRASLIATTIKSGQEPAQWFTLPGIIGAPSLKTNADLGIKFNAGEAKQVLDAYLREKNTTADKLDLTLAYNTSPGNQKIAETVQAMWRATLGVNVKLSAQEWSALTKSVKSKTASQIWRFGWCLEYPDANNFLRDVVASGGSINADTGLNWQDAKYQDLVKKAAVEKDAAARANLYAQAEKILVNDAAVIMPVYWYTRGALTQPWIKRTVAFTGRERYERWQIQP
ncbi:MAG: peptide ABC transporter substrate-binding protein [Chloroflexi bacterium]|nr:peptide ABC transporter substrate-binding protein [Chloroflexota bacterium]